MIHNLYVAWKAFCAVFKPNKKVIFIFDAVENKEDIYFAQRGFDWWQVAWDLDNHLRYQIKYNSDLSEQQYNCYQDIRDKLYYEMNDKGVSFEEVE